MTAISEPKSDPNMGSLLFLLYSVIPSLISCGVAASVQWIDAGSTLYNSEDGVKVLQCGVPPEAGIEYEWLRNYNRTLPAGVVQFGTTLM